MVSPLNVVRKLQADSSNMLKIVYAKLQGSKIIKGNGLRLLCMSLFQFIFYINSHSERWIKSKRKETLTLCHQFSLANECYKNPFIKETNMCTSQSVILIVLSKHKNF